MNLSLVVECSRAQSLNSCKRVGVRVTPHSYWDNGSYVQLAWGRVKFKQTREREEICMGRGTRFYTFMFFHREFFLHGVFLTNNGFLSVGACRKLLWTCLVVVWSYNFIDKETMFLGETSFSKFIQEACVLVGGWICVAVVKFLKSQQIEFLPNLCWKPGRGVERPMGLRPMKGDSIPWVV